MTNRTPTETELEQREICDEIIKDTVARIQDQGVPIHIMIDRLATYAAYGSTLYAGKAHTAEQFRQMADTVEAGLFDDLNGEKGHA